MATSSTPTPRFRWGELLWLALCAGILAWKLLLPGFIGMADNGDFPKVAGPLSLGSPEAGRQNYFQPLYLRESRYRFTPHIPTSELVLAWTASTLEQAIGDRSRFDVRWLGAIHGLLFLYFYYSVLSLLRPLSPIPRSALSLLALWIFADIGTLAYFNTFYTDAAAILGGLATAVLAALLLARPRPTASMLVLFGMAALLWVTSKAQHGLFGIVPAGPALLWGWRAIEKRARATGLLVGVVLLAASIWIVNSPPGWYKAVARFNLIFFRILKESPVPTQDLAELGLSAQDASYIGLDSFSKGGPMESPAWVDGFLQRCTYGRLLSFYVRHPVRTLGMLRSDLRGQTWQRRAPGLSNFTRTSGRPEGAMATSLGSWGALRAWTSRVWPAQISIWLGLLPLAAVWLARRDASPWRRALAWTIVAVSLLAWGEFGIGCLADGIETARHLAMFHIFTDMVLFLGMVLTAGLLEAACPIALRKPAGAVVVAGLIIFTAATVKSEVYPEVLPPAPVWDSAGAIDDTDPSVVYSGHWSSGAFQSAFHGTLTFSDDPGAIVRFSFEGTELQYIYTQAPNRGLAAVTIDGKMQRTIDLYAPQIVWQVPAVVGGLPPGTHHAEIRVTGQHNPAASGNFIDVDALKGR